MALGTVPQPEGVANPTLADLVKHTDGNQYALAMFAAKRARQINAYFNQLNEGLLQNVGPLVEYDAKEKPLSIAFREINEGLLEQTLADNNESDSAKEKETAAEVKEEYGSDHTAEGAADVDATPAGAADTSDDADSAEASKNEDADSSDGSDDSGTADAETDSDSDDTDEDNADADSDDEDKD